MRTSDIPLLQNPKADWPDRKLFVHCGRWNPGKRADAIFKKCAVRTQQWRLINNTVLHDIKNDPSETKDVAADHPEVVADLQKAYRQWWDSTQPLLVNKGLPKVAPEDQPFALRYKKQAAGKGIPEWAPKPID